MGDLQPWLLIGSVVLLALGLLLLMLRPSRKAVVNVGNANSNVTITNVAGDQNNGGAALGPSAGWQWFFGWAGIGLGLIGIAISLWPTLKGP
ncbi:MAG: hypothetical protein JHC88_05425 [Niveispirillum sp.]|nr:hypothetical protein [Niveispirillum sp.]